MGMAMRVLIEDELYSHSVTALGLNASTYALTSTEAISAALRRVAGFFCPCPSQTLIQSVLKPLESINIYTGSLQEEIKTALDAMVSYGDLIEQNVVDAEQASSGTLLYIAPPGFVWREDQSALLLGIAPDHVSALPPDLEIRIKYKNHIRRLEQLPGENLRSELLQIGLVQLSAERWMNAPEVQYAEEHIQQIKERFKPVIGNLPGLKILNPELPVRYYPGRWEDAKNQSGCFVAKRPQAYGNGVWCYVELEQGRPSRIVEFPTLGGKLRGCDEAWYLQAAIDAIRGNPQLYRIREENNLENPIVEFFSPVPMWARRRWDTLGELGPRKGCLFSYVFSAGDIPEEADFIENRLWLRRISE
jgi:hypothetical protein